MVVSLYTSPKTKTTDVYAVSAASLETAMIAMLTYRGTGDVPRGRVDSSSKRERGAGYWLSRGLAVIKEACNRVFTPYN